MIVFPEIRMFVYVDEGGVFLHDTACKRFNPEEKRMIVIVEYRYVSYTLVGI